MQRFPVEASAIPAAPSEEDSWCISPATSSAFRNLADSACMILTKCKEKCRAQKLQGSCDALCEVLNFMRDRGTATKFITWDEFNQHCTLLLAREERPAGAVALPTVPLPPPEPAALAPRGEKGWEDVDSMFVDPEFKAGCFLFTHFFKERTKEIRLAYVCGFRNALLEVLEWVSKIHHMDLMRVSCEATVAVCAAQVRKIAEVATRSKLTYSRLGAAGRDEMLAALAAVPLAAPFPSPSPSFAPLDVLVPSAPQEYAMPAPAEPSPRKRHGSEVDEPLFKRVRELNSAYGPE